MAKVYDVLILGGGPAGLTAALYTARSRLSTLIVEKAIPGGQIALAERVENFPGFPQGISGMELGERMHQQAAHFGAETLMAAATGMEVAGRVNTVATTEGPVQGRALILALGAEPKKLGAQGEAELLGKGVSYCAYCDAPLFSDQEVAVVGGGNTALTDALYIARYARRVKLIHRRRQLRAEAILQEQARAEPRIEFLWDTVVERVEGEKVVNGLRLRRVDTGEQSFLPVSGVFVAIGGQPNAGFLAPLLKLSPEGFLLTDNIVETGLSGIFACGEVRLGATRQAIACAGEGATAGLAAVSYLQQLR